MRGHKKNCAVILTAIPVEYEAVLAHLEDLHSEYCGEAFYQRGTFASGGCEWEIVIRKIGHGNVCAGIETTRAIYYFNPLVLLFVGVAGGLKDVKIGDIVVPAKVYTYESGRANADSFSTRPHMRDPAFLLSEVACVQGREENWFQRATSETPVSLPGVFHLPLASGESVVASTASDVYKFIRHSYDDAVAVDMESYGFLSAAAFSPQIKALVIRGISDLIDNKGSAEKSDSQKLAANYASAFAFELLANLDVMGRSEARPEADSSLNYNHREKVFHADLINDKYKRIIDHETVTSENRDLSRDRYMEEIYGIIHGLQTNFSDSCKAIIRIMKSMEAKVNKLYGSNQVLDRNGAFILSNLRDQIKDMHSFAKSCLSLSLSEGRRSGLAAAKKQMYRKLHLLLEKLRQLEEWEKVTLIH